MTTPTPFESKTYQDGEVLRPLFQTELEDKGLQPLVHLRMQKFQKTAHDASLWEDAPLDEWPIVATLHSDRIVLRPVHDNPYALRYLSPRHGRFRTVTYVDGERIELPSDEKSALDQLGSRLPYQVFDDIHVGLGLNKVFEPVWKALQRLTPESNLVILHDGVSRTNNGVIEVSFQDLNQLRLSLNRIDRRKRDGVRAAKYTVVHNDLLSKLDPARFVRSEPSTPRAKPSMVRVNPAHVSQRERRISRASIEAVRESLPTLAAVAPSELLELRSEIERVTLTEMVHKYDAMLKQDLTEPRWQKFFEANQVILSMAFARPVRLLTPQFHAQPAGIHGSGAKVGDFLFGELGQGLAIVEIKAPSTKLMLSTAYRNEVYGPSSELSGAITQTLTQRSTLSSHWLLHRTSEILKSSSPHSIKCVVVAGRTPELPGQRASFEIFRNACRDVDVITYDELLEKLKLLLQHLTPEENRAEVEPPF